MDKERDKAKRQKELFLGKLEEMPVVSVLCQKLRISKSSLYRWLRDDLEFKERFDEIKKKGDENINDLAKSVVIQNMKNGSLAAAKYWLDNKDADFIKNRFRYEKNNSPEPIDFIITTIDKSGKVLNKKKVTKKLIINQNLCSSKKTQNAS